MRQLHGSYGLRITFGIAVDLRLGNLLVVSLSTGTIYEIFRE